MRVTYDAKTGYAYIGFTPSAPAQVAESLPLEDWASDAGVPALDDLILDFDAEGRLLGIEVSNAQNVLPASLLAHAKNP